MKLRILGKIAEALTEDLKDFDIPEITADVIAEAYLSVNEAWIKNDLVEVANDKGIDYAEDAIRASICNGHYEYNNSIPDAIDEIIDNIWDDPPIKIDELYSVDALIMTLNEDEHKELIDELRCLVIQALKITISIDD